MWNVFDYYRKKTIVVLKKKKKKYIFNCIDAKEDVIPVGTSYIHLITFNSLFYMKYGIIVIIIIVIILIIIIITIMNMNMNK